MEGELSECIDIIDLTPNSENLIIFIHDTIKSWYESSDPDEDQEVCYSVSEAYSNLCNLERHPISFQTWRAIYDNFRSLRNDIKNEIIEHDLTPRERMSNLHLVDGILFYIKLTILRMQPPLTPPPTPETPDSENNSV